jgi:hypothetical protein
MITQISMNLRAISSSSVLDAGRQWEIDVLHEAADAHDLLLEAAQKSLALLEDPRLMKNEIDMAERFADVTKSLYAAISKAKGETE